MSKARSPADAGKRFRDMTRHQKVVFVCKAFVFFISGGFAYPTLWVD